MILPGATIGILGGGQLGRMSALAARPLGYRIHIYDPQEDCPAASVADRVFAGAFTEESKLKTFLDSIDVLTFEFENVAPGLLRSLAPDLPIRPSPGILETAQHRVREKLFFREHGLPCAPFHIVRSAEDLAAATADLGFPCVLKTAAFGYDGKGQQTFRKEACWEDIWADFGAPEGVVEKWLTFAHELSVLIARSPSGAMAHFAPAANEHRHHILHTSMVPGPFPEAVQTAAVNLARRVAEALQLEGLLAVEMFLTHEGELVLNEMAPRPHNSGHHTIEACVTSQFEQHIRAICDLPLGDPGLRHPVVMTNLLGDLWQDGEPDWTKVLNDPRQKLHLYGKTDARPGRKMGHFTTLGDPGQEPPAERAAKTFAELAKRPEKE